MALIEKNTIDYSFDRLVQRRIFKNNIGCLTSQFKSSFFIGACNSALNDLTYFGRAGESNLIDIGMVDQICSGGTSASDDIDYTWRKIGFLNELRQLQCSQGGGFRRLQYNCIARC